jgi:hypothetical protein
MVCHGPDCHESREEAVEQYVQESIDTNEVGGLVGNQRGCGEPHRSSFLLGEILSVEVRSKS